MKNCCICGTTFFSHSDTESDPVCRAFECRRVYENQKNTNTAVLANHFATLSQTIREKKQQAIADAMRKEAAEKAEKSAILQRENEENQRLYNKTIRRYPHLNKKYYPLVVLSSYHYRVTETLSSERKQNYINHLQKIIDIVVDDIVTDKNAIDVKDSFSRAEKTACVDEDKMAVIDGLVCGVCRGRCCINGGDKAYLKPETIKRYMSQNPHLSAEQVLMQYRDKLGEKTHAESCINHTETGCNLPKEMRSDTCNNFYCEAVKTLNKKFSGESVVPKGALVLSRPLNSTELDIKQIKLN